MARSLYFGHIIPCSDSKIAPRSFKTYLSPGRLNLPSGEGYIAH